MTVAQRQQALTLMETYIKNVRPELAKRELERLTAAGIDTIYLLGAELRQRKPR